MSSVILSCVDVPAICLQRSDRAVSVSQTAAGAGDVNEQQGYGPHVITAVVALKRVGSEHGANGRQNLRQPSVDEAQAERKREVWLPGD